MAAGSIYYFDTTRANSKPGYVEKGILADIARSARVQSFNPMGLCGLANGVRSGPKKRK